MQPRSLAEYACDDERTQSGESDLGYEPENVVLRIIPCRHCADEILKRNRLPIHDDLLVADLVLDEVNDTIGAELVKDLRVEHSVAIIGDQAAGLRKRLDLQASRTTSSGPFTTSSSPNPPALFPEESPPRQPGENISARAFATRSIPRADFAKERIRGVIHPGISGGCA